MSKTKDFEERYKKGDLTWDTGKRDKNLEQVIKEYSILPCSVLELGAGTGSDAIWLSKKGFKVTAIDVSATAVKIARRKAADANTRIEFIVADILRIRFQLALLILYSTAAVFTFLNCRKKGHVLQRSFGTV